MLVTPSHMGLDGFVWWFGVVESRSDPLKLRRIQVRIEGWYTPNLNKIPSGDLPWAQVPDHMDYVREGSRVVGWFLDGEAGQFPVVLAAFPGIPVETPNQSRGFSDQRSVAALAASPRPPQARVYGMMGDGVSILEQSSASLYPDRVDEPTTSRLERNYNIEETIVQEKIDNVITNVPIAGGGTWSEPQTDYWAVYPYNHVEASESGHVIEVDDTPGHERLHWWHRSGTFQEIQADGTRVLKIVHPDFQIMLSDENMYVMGKLNITVQGDTNLQVNGNLNEVVMGQKNSTIMGGLNEYIVGDVSRIIMGDLNETVTGTLNEQVLTGAARSVVGTAAVSATIIQQTALTSILMSGPAGAPVPATMTGAMTITGATTINGATNLNGATNIEGVTTVTGNIEQTGELDITGGPIKVNGVTVIVP